MRRLFRNATMVDPGSPFHNQIIDILVREGVIVEIGTAIQDLPGDEIHNLQGQYISPGFCDLFADFCDPGFEFKENLSTGCRTALAGGYTAIVLSPATQPVRDNKAQVEYALAAAGNLIPSILPLGALTVGIEGKAPSEMLDMYHSGAVAYSDGLHYLRDAGILMRALEYARLSGTTVYSYPLDLALSKDLYAAESPIAAALGLKGIPALAEELVVQRDIELVEYTGGRLHFTAISTAGSVHLIRKAKERGVPITCAVSPFHFYFDDSVITSFESKYKLNPVLRTSADKAAIIEGLIDGTIDAICSLHTPQNVEATEVEYEYALPGAISLQTVLSMSLEVLGDKMELGGIIKLLSHNPRQIIGRQASVREGQPADFTWFNPVKIFTLDASTNLSLSQNTPVWNVPMKGTINGVIYHNHIYINE